MNSTKNHLQMKGRILLTNAMLMLILLLISKENLFDRLLTIQKTSCMIVALKIIELEFDIPNVSKDCSILLGICATKL